VKLNRQCKACDTYYRDPGGDPEDPKRHCPSCGSWAWYWVNDQEDLDGRADA
jgi:rRNA maturation endonuclease Nob1